MDDCTWEITAPPGHLVTLDFDRIDVSKSHHSQSDKNASFEYRIIELFAWSVNKFFRLLAGKIICLRAYFDKILNTNVQHSCHFG